MTYRNNCSRIKIGLIVDSATVSHYVADLVEWSLQCDEPPITHLIIQSLPRQGQRGTFGEKFAHLVRMGVKKLIGTMLWRAILAVERRMIRQEPSANHLRMRDVSRLVPNHIHVVPTVSQSGYVYRYSVEDVARLQTENFHILIRCGSGILQGEVLRVARDGILSFHHADNTVNRGGPPGFWEVYRRERSTGFTIQQLTEELDGGNVLLRGRFQTATFYLRNQANLFRRSNYYLIRLLERYLIAGHLPEPQTSVPYSGPLYRVPGPAVSIHYLVRNAFDLARSRFTKHVLQRRQIWGFSFVRKRWREAALWRGQRIRAPEGRFFADPFVVSRDGNDYCFVEDYDYELSKGCISALRLTDQGAEFLGPVIVEPFHMSFPYIFEYESKTYMVPETCQSNDIRIYEAQTFPTRWRLASIAMTDVSAADSMIFEHEGRWWLFTNMDLLGEADHCSELMIYYSDNPLDHHWRAHAENPIYIDSERARNGGLLREGRQVYRVAQVQGFNQYGAEAAIYRIVELTPTAYREELEVRIRPTFYPSLRGTHHMHGNEHITVFDHVECVDAPLRSARAHGRRRQLEFKSGLASAQATPGRRGWRE